jgi:hypothetical protein
MTNLGLAPVEFHHLIILPDDWLTCWIVTPQVQSSNPGTEDKFFSYVNHVKFEIKLVIKFRTNSSAYKYFNLIKGYDWGLT